MILDTVMVYVYSELDEIAWSINLFAQAITSYSRYTVYHYVSSIIES